LNFFGIDIKRRLLEKEGEKIEELLNLKDFVYFSMKIGQAG